MFLGKAVFKALRPQQLRKPNGVGIRRLALFAPHTALAPKRACLLLQPHGQPPELMSKTRRRFLLAGRIAGRQTKLTSVLTDLHCGQAGCSRSESTRASNMCLQL
jgi:hypothetical protein